MYLRATLFHLQPFDSILESLHDVLDYEVNEIGIGPRTFSSHSSVIEEAQQVTIMKP
jgi:hypothetical protein